MDCTSSIRIRGDSMLWCVEGELEDPHATTLPYVEVDCLVSVARSVTHIIGPHELTDNIGNNAYEADDR